MTRDLGQYLAISRPVLDTPKGRGRLIWWAPSGPRAKFVIDGRHVMIPKDDLHVPLWRWLRARALADSMRMRAILRSGGRP